MKRLLSTMLMTMVVGVAMMMAQVVTTNPAIVQQSSKNIVVTFHPDQGSGGLKGYTGDVYAHTGVITNLSNGSWVYAPNWGDNAAKYKLTRNADGTYSLNIPDIRSYYGITNASEVVQKLAFVFRSGDCSREGKDVGNKDIFVDVAEDGVTMDFTSTLDSPVVTIPSSATFVVTTTQNASIELKVNGTVVATTTGTRLEHKYEFTAPGNYTFLATATASGEVLTRQLEYTAIAAPVSKPYPGGVPRQGAVTNADGTVTFCIAAPGKQMVYIVPAWDDYKLLASNLMNYQDYNNVRYFWITVSGLKKSTDYPYYYQVDGVKVADPYARLILDPNNDKWIPSSVWPEMPVYPSDKVSGTPLAVYRSDINSYNWRVTNFQAPDKDDLLIYEILLRDFTGTNNTASANGTLRAAIEKIPYIQQLGFNAVELMPIMEFSGNNSWGYNPNFYMAPDKAYGSPDDYKEFIDECHRHGIAVILDIALNHADGDAPWYRMYNHGESPFFNGTAPHDYSVFNDWRQEYAPVRQYWADVLTMWMQEYKVDGFRFDLVKGLGDSDSYGAGTEAYNASRIANMKALHKVILQNNPRGIHINEGFMGSNEDNELAADGQLNWFNVNDASGKWAAGQSSNLTQFYATASGRTLGSTVSYAESHDEQRIAYTQTNSNAPADLTGSLKQRMARLAAGAAQMILTPGSHMVWQFGELGDSQNNKKGGDNNTDPKIVVWSYLDNGNRASLKNSYQELLWIRRANPDLFDEAATVDLLTGSNDWANGRFIHCKKDGREILLMVNTDVAGARTLSRTVTSMNASNYAVLSSSAAFSGDPVVNFSGNTVSVNVPANGYVVLGTINTSGVEDITDDITADAVITAANGSISIYGLNGGSASVYTTAGLLVNTLDADGVLSVAPGIYIVKTATKAVKVLVR